MVRYILLLGFWCMLLWGSTACAPLPHKPEALSEHGYRVSLQVSNTLIFLGASGASLPQASEVMVRVRDAQGQPVDGLLVVFSAEPSWTQNARSPLWRRAPAVAKHTPSWRPIPQAWCILWHASIVSRARQGLLFKAVLPPVVAAGVMSSMALVEFAGSWMCRWRTT